jgi:hypothetical protein
VAVLLALMEVFEGFDAEASTHAPTSHPPTSHRAWADVVADNDLDSATPTVVAPPHGGGLVDASKVQEALRDAEPGRWAVGEMHDASEALEALLDILERVIQIGGAHSRWGRQAKHRVPSLTEIFGLFTCEGAGATKAAPAVTTRSWVRHLLRSTVDAAVSSAESPSSAGSSSIAASTPAAACPALAIALRGTTPTRKAVAEPTAMSAGDWGERVLLTGTPPRVYTINLVHDTSSPSDEQIGRLLHGICDALPLQDVHPEVLGRQQRQQRGGARRRYRRTSCARSSALVTTTTCPTPRSRRADAGACAMTARSRSLGRVSTTSRRTCVRTCTRRRCSFMRRERPNTVRVTTKQSDVETRRM